MAMTDAVEIRRDDFRLARKIYDFVLNANFRLPLHPCSIQRIQRARDRREQINGVSSSLLSFAIVHLFDHQ